MVNVKQKKQNLVLLDEAEKPDFPDVSMADSDGLLAFGGKLSPEWLLEAYTNGIFPWFNEGDPILWWSPHPRMVLKPADIKISKSMRPLLKKGSFEISYNRAFAQVITNCAKSKRAGQEGTWITTQMRDAYIKLHELGWAHSVEAWQNKQLVGGLYGVLIGQVFFGESMFSKVSNASKSAFIEVVRKLELLGVHTIDCQIYSKHLESLGAKEIDRTEFIKSVKKGCASRMRLAIK